MKYPAYPEYQDHGVEWLGPMPAHWEVKRLRFASRGIEQGWSPQCENQAADDDAWGVMKVGCVNGDEFDALENKALPQNLEPKSEYELYAGDILISRANTKELLGSAAIVPNGVRPRLLLCDKLFRLLPKPDVNQSFLTSYLRTSAARFQYERSATGASGSMQNIGHDTLKNLVVPLPSADEQGQIANFLDWKTAQIDALIAKKQELIAKLKEKRIAVITQAVTKGLDPNTPLRASGIPWLGRVPAHWIVGGFTKFVIHRADYRGKTPEKVRDGIFLVTARNIKAGAIDYDASQEFVLEDDYEQTMSRGMPVIGDLLFTTEAPLGEVANIDREDIALAQRVIKFRGEPDKLSNYFAKYWMMSIGFQGHLSSLATGSTAKGIKASKLFALRCVVPPLDEQELIVKYLDRKLREFDSMEGKIKEVIARLTEYRSALITAATTGKIDLRGWQAEKEAA